MNMGKSRLLTCVALALAAAFIVGTSAQAGLFGLWGGKKKPKVDRVPVRTLIVFPFDQGAQSSTPEDFGEYVASDVRTMLAADARFSALLYRDRLAPVQRAKEDGGLKAPDIEPPYANDKAKALKLAQLLATELYLVGEIDDYNFDPAKKIAMVTLRAELYDGKTGKLVKTLLVSAASPDSAKQGDEDELRDMAKGAAVTKLVAEILAEPATEEVPAPAAQPENETKASN